MGGTVVVVPQRQGITGRGCSEQRRFDGGVIRSGKTSPSAGDQATGQKYQKDYNRCGIRYSGAVVKYGLIKVLTNDHAC